MCKVIQVMSTCDLSPELPRPAVAAERRCKKINAFKDFRTEKWLKTRPESGLDWLIFFKLLTPPPTATTPTSLNPYMLSAAALDPPNHNPQTMNPHR